jgi:hypothetical protein
VRMVSKTQIIGQTRAYAEKRQEPRTGDLPEADPAIAVETAGCTAEIKLPLDPTRYGDWEKNGRCIDF